MNMVLGFDMKIIVSTDPLDGIAGKQEVDVPDADAAAELVINKCLEEKRIVYVDIPDGADPKPGGFWDRLFTRKDER